MIDHPIKVFAPNLPHRDDRRESLLSQFSVKPEFRLAIIEAQSDKIGAWGLWRTFLSIVRMAKEDTDDFFIFCEDDVFFTEHYTKEKFF